MIEKYKKLLIDSLESDTNKNTSKFDSVLSLIGVDENLTPKQKEEILLYGFDLLLDVLEKHKNNLLTNPLTTDKEIDKYNNLINETIESIDNEEIGKSDKFNLN